MAFDDLLDYIRALDGARELHAVEDEVDWDLELGAFSRYALEQDRRPVWFKRIKDYPEHAAFAHLVPNFRAAAIAMCLPADTPDADLRRTHEQRIATPIPPIEVASGPAQTNVVRGDKIDLTELPAPMLHDGDGGRYVGTWDLVVTQDPETKVSNWGVYRYMLNDRRHLGGNVGLGGSATLRKHYLPRNEAMPVAIVIGADPLSHMAAASNPPPGVEESAMAGALRAAPVPLVKALLSELRVPAHAQMVIEGVVLPDRVGPEGPYGEFTGYRSGDGDHGVIVRVDAITHRDRPIHTVDCTGWRAGVSPFNKFVIERGLRAALGARGVTVHAVNVPLDTAYGVAYISTERGGREVARTVLEAVQPFARATTKIFLFDADVDVNDPDDVMHAFAMRCPPRHGILIQPHEGRVQRLTPFLSREERRTLSAATVVFDCTWPSTWDRMQEVPAKNFFEAVYGEDTKRQVRSRWRALGLPSKEVIRDGLR